MEREEKIQKWLRGELSEEELKDFEQSDEFKLLTRIDRSLHQFKAPEYSGTTSFIDSSDIKISKIKQFKKRTGVYLSAAAVFIAMCSIVLYLYQNQEISQVVIDSSSQKSIYLPDSSFVKLNLNSNISFSPESWEDNRTLQLAGEAFFKVDKGDHFTVETAMGKVVVLGTEFNVISRNDYFEVTCFEGKVEVTIGGSSIDLTPGKSARLLNGKISKRSLSVKNNDVPDWMNGETSFKSLPAKIVLKEFERQYNVTFNSKRIDTNQLISGSFVHGEIQIALESISIPLNCTYKIAEDQITLFNKDTP